MGNCLTAALPGPASRLGFQFGLKIISLGHRFLTALLTGQTCCSPKAERSRPNTHTGEWGAMAARGLLLCPVPMSLAVVPASEPRERLCRCSSDLHLLLPAPAPRTTQKILFGPNPKRPRAGWHELSLPLQRFSHTDSASPGIATFPRRWCRGKATRAFPSGVSAHKRTFLGQAGLFALAGAWPWSCSLCS